MPPTWAGLNFQSRAASSDLPEKYLLGPGESSVASVTLPFASTEIRTDTLTVPLIVRIALGIMSGKIWFMTAWLTVGLVGAGL